MTVLPKSNFKIKFDYSCVLQLKPNCDHITNRLALDLILISFATVTESITFTANGTALQSVGRNRTKTVELRVKREVSNLRGTGAEVGAAR